MNSEKWLIRGGWAVHGEVELSGDTNSAISNICHALALSSGKNIRNVPRSQEVLEFIEFLNRCGFSIEWKSIDRIYCYTNWEKFNSDLSQVTFENSKFFELVVNIVLYKTKKCIVPLKFRKHLERFKRLKMKLSLVEDAGYEITVPDEIQFQKIHIKSAERDFYTVLSYALLKLTYEEIYITPSSAYDPIVIFNDHTYSKNSVYKVSMNLREFNFFASLAVLTEGEITIRNVELSEALSYLLNLYNIGATYEVDNDSLRIWYDFKKIEQYYSLTKSAPDEIGYLLMYISAFSKNKVLVKARNTPIILEVIKNLNIMGCQMSYTDLGSESIMIEVKPSGLKSFRQQIPNVNYGGIILAAAFLYEGNSIVSDLEYLSRYIPFFSDNLQNIGLKFVIR